MFVAYINGNHVARCKAQGWQHHYDGVTTAILIPPDPDNPDAGIFDAERWVKTMFERAHYVCTVPVEGTTFAKD